MLFDPSVVIKGDFVGHPFRGNQWSDASGASLSGATSATEGRTKSRRFKAEFGDDRFEVDEAGMLKFLVAQHGDRKYSEEEKQAALTYLSEMYFGDINLTLRMQAVSGDSLEESYVGADNDPEGVKVVLGAIATLDKLMADSTLSEDVTVYRGVTDEDGEFRDHIVSEGGILDPAYQSTSLNSVVANAAAGGMTGEGFDGVKGVTMEIRIPKGARALAVEKVAGVYDPTSPSMMAIGAEEVEIAGYSIGAEILLPRGTYLKFEGIRLDEQLGEVLQMTVTSQESQ